MGKGDKRSAKGKRFGKSYGVSRPRNKGVNFVPSYVCYISMVKLISGNMAAEHIIPNAFGGRLKSKHLLTRDWNNFFGETIDAELINLIPLPTILNIKRQDGKNPKIRAVTEDGIKYVFDSTLQGKKRPARPKEILLPDGRTKIEFLEGQEEDILNSLKKKYPKLDIDNLRKKIIWKASNIGRAVFPENGLDIITGPEAFRGICKIATNFYVFKSNDVYAIQPIVPFLKGEDAGIGKIKYYYPSEYEIHKMGQKEISHLIIVIGDKASKLLYSYVELFNCHSFLIILNSEYAGKDVSYSYCFDISNQKEISKKINLYINREELENMNHQDQFTEKNYIFRLQRLAQISDFELAYK